MLSSVCLYCFAIWATLVSTQSTYINMTIPLNKTLLPTEKELYWDYIFLEKSSSINVKFTDVDKQISFIIFQVHSHMNNVTLKYSNSDKSLVGTNLGLFSLANQTGGPDMFEIYNFNDVDVKVFVAVHGYKKTDPVPGGCNMEFPIPISPFMKTVVHNKTYIDIEVSSFSIGDNPCIVFVKDFYFAILYLPEQNYDADVYFEAIRNMSVLKGIEKYGTRIPESSNNYWLFRRRLSAYPGTGAIFVAVAKTDDAQYSVYVPTHSYACSPLLEYDCELLEDSLTMFLSSIIFFLGIFICYFGHRFFKTQLMSLGFLSGFVITYIVLSIICDIDGPALVAASAISGLIVGGLRLVCWWLYGIPAFIIVLSSVDVGFLMSSILYYISPGGVYLQDNLTFWSLFMGVLFLTTLFLLSLSYVACLICYAVIGAYTAIYPLDYYIGSNLKYILNNAVRRATVPDFNKAVIMPIYQWKDVLLTILWMVLAVTGFVCQYYHNKGRPPFPPPPRSVRAVPEYAAEAVVRRRSSIARYWEKWRQRRRNTRNNLRNTVNERTPLLEED